MNRRDLMGWGAAILSGALLVFAFPPFAVGPLAWFALVPLGLAIRRAPDPKAAANLGAVTGLVFYCVALHWMLKLFGPLAAGYWCIFGLWIAAWAWLLKRAQLRAGRRGWLAAGGWVVLAGVAWTGLEYFRSEVFWLPCSWLTLGSSQTAFLPALQSVSVWGVYGLSGVLAATNAALALRFDGRRVPARVMVATAVLLLVWGGRRLGAGLEADGTVLPVAAVQDESMTLGHFVRATRSQAARDAALVVWPEYGYQVARLRPEDSRRLLVRALRGTRAVVVVGAASYPADADPKKLKRGDVRNFVWVIGPDGALLGRYDKLHPIPVVEAWLEPNPSPAPIATPAGHLGVQICYDLDFENGSRSVVRQGAEVLAVPDMDPLDWGTWQHAQHSGAAPVRAAETGRWIVRATSSGISQLIDPVGRVTASLPTGTEGPLAGTVRRRAGETPYVRFGWLAGPVCLGLTAAAFLALAGVGLPLGSLLVAGNLGVFLVTSSLILGNLVPLSHHWLFPIHEALLLVQVLVFPPRRTARALTGLSALVLGISVARIQTIYLSHHLIHFVMCWGLAALLHGRLGSRRDVPSRRWQRWAARAAWVVAAAAAVVAWHHGIWWGLADGTES